MSKNPSFFLARKIIENFLKKENIKWPQETKIALKLLKTYPEQGFWENFKLDFKLNSLAFFLTYKGNNFIKKGYSVYKYQNELSKQFKENKPKNIIEFINEH